MRVLLTRFGMRPVVLSLALIGVLTLAGCGGSNSSSSGANATATPTFSPGAGTYNTSQTVTIADTTKGAVLYCTTDGTTPTASSSPCSQPTTVSKSEFLQAIAVAPGQAPSAVASAGYTIDLNAVPTPTFTPAGSTLTSGQQVTITDTLSGANIYYTLDGSVPMVNGTTTKLYTGPIAFTKSVTLSAIAVASGYNNSGVASAAYTVSTTPATPVIAPAGGTFTAIQPVTITDATSGASIYYTLDGSTPTANSTAYSGAFNVSTSQTVSAIAISPGGGSTVATAAFIVNIPVTPAPTFNPGTGTYTSTQTVLLTDTNPSAIIYYTTDGSMPTASSQQYSSSGISVTSTETIKAIAIAPGLTASGVSSATYTINSTVSPPTFSPAGGTYATAKSVSLSDMNTSATIYYTTDGSTPTTTSMVFSSAQPIQVGSGTTTINAIAAINAGDMSTMATATYTINTGPTIAGKVMSGPLPVIGAMVQMYSAGNTGYASSAAVQSSTPAMTGSDGSFTLSYSCPAAGGDLVYLVATGGHTGSNTASNVGLAFMAALGSCNGTLPKPVVNEVTTVASAYALSPFMTGAANVGSSSSNYEKGAQSTPGLANAFATVNNLANLTSGTTLTHTPDYPTNLAGDINLVNNSTVPTARINTLANALNACAVDGSGCSSLFSAATPSSGKAPTDTLQAILNIAQNPGNNVGDVYAVAGGSTEFASPLSAAPNDWTLALTFTGGGLGFTPDLQIPGINKSPFTDGKFVNTAIAIDATGNVWVTGFSLSRSGGNNLVADLNSGMIAEFSNSGKPITGPSSVAAGGAVTYGGYIPITGAANNGGTQAPLGIAFDPSGNAWVAGGSSPSNPAGPGAMTEINPGLSVANAFISLGSASNAPIAIDGIGDVWTFGSGGILEFDNTGTKILSNFGTNPPLAPFGYNEPQSLVFDSNAASLFASDANGFGDLFQINPASGLATVDYFATSNTAVYTPLVAGSATNGLPGNVYGCGSTGQSLDVYNVSSTSILNSYPISTGRGCGKTQMAIDGTGHIFAVTGSTGSTITPGIIDEFTITGTGITPVSPTATGYTGTSSGETPTINGDPNPPLVAGATPRLSTGGVAAVAIDGSGNLWVLNVDTGTDASLGNALVEYVGIAAPIVTPTSQALANAQVGVRP